MSDIVERLREEGLGFGIGPALVCQEAAAEIDRLRSELAEAREERDEAIALAERLDKDVRGQLRLNVKLFNKQADAESELARAREEVERWKYAFAAQSRKLKAVLHIPGVKDELAALQPEEKT